MLTTIVSAPLPPPAWPPWPASQRPLLPLPRPRPRAQPAPALLPVPLLLPRRLRLPPVPRRRSQHRLVLPPLRCSRLPVSSRWTGVGRRRLGERGGRYVIYNSVVGCWMLGWMLIASWLWKPLSMLQSRARLPRVIVPTVFVLFSLPLMQMQNLLDFIQYRWLSFDMLRRCAAKVEFIRV